MAFWWPQKDPDDLLDYGINWAQFLGPDVITASTWQIAPDGLTESASSFSPQIATIWLSGGDVNQVYSVTNRIVTAAGRIVDQTVQIKISQN